MLATESALSGSAPVVAGRLYCCYGSPADDGSGRVIQCPSAVTTAAGLLGTLTDGSTSLSTCDVSQRSAAGPFNVGPGPLARDLFGT
jgi:hypothetical protein